jgi:hypothetical protein
VESNWRWCLSRCSGGGEGRRFKAKQRCGPMRRQLINDSQGSFRDEHRFFFFESKHSILRFYVNSQISTDLLKVVYTPIDCHGEDKSPLPIPSRHTPESVASDNQMLRLHNLGAHSPSPCHQTHRRILHRRTNRESLSSKPPL